MLRGFITDDESSLSLMINVQTVHKYTIKESLSVCDCNWNFGRCFYADDFIADFGLTVLTHHWRAHMHGMRIIPKDHFASDQLFSRCHKAEQSESGMTALMKFKRFGFGSCREKVTGRSHLFFLLCVIYVYLCFHRKSLKTTQWPQSASHHCSLTAASSQALLSSVPKREKYF